MNMLKRVGLITICFFAAIACYVFGMPAGGVALFILGLLFESLFWLGLFGRKKKYRQA